MVRSQLANTRRRFRFLLGLGIAALVLTLAAPALAQEDLSGTYRIQVVANSKYVHLDGCCSQVVTTIWQPDDDFTRFRLQRQDDGSYRIQSKATGLYLHDDGGGDQWLSTRYQPDDNFTRFFFQRISPNVYRIRVKATNRYVHDNGYGDQILSTRFDVSAQDSFAHFRLFQEGSPTCESSDTAICLRNGRFRASVEFHTASSSPSPAKVVRARADDSGLFWFFNERNWEMLIKVLNGCPANGHFWVFYAATTNVGFTLTVEDTLTGVVKEYSNPLGTNAVPVNDVTAFATCP